MAQGRSARRRRGAVLVLGAIAVFVYMAVLALTVDVGRMSVTKAVLQNGCDAGALAGAQVLFRQRVAGLSEAMARAVASQEASAIFGANCPGARTIVTFGTRSASAVFVLATEADTATMVKVMGHRDESAPGGSLGLIFARLLGLGKCNIAARGVAEVSARISAIRGELAPFAVPRENIVDVGDMIFYPADYDAYNSGLGEDSVAPGCWGLVNLDGGDLSTPEMVDWIENGYDGEIVVDVDAGGTWLDGTTGFRAALVHVMRAKVGQPMTVLIYDQVVGTGATADFLITGFLRITVTGCRLVGQNPYISCEVLEVTTLHDLTAIDGNTSPNIRKVQLVQ